MFHQNRFAVQTRLGFIAFFIRIPRKEDSIFAFDSTFETNKEAFRRFLRAIDTFQIHMCSTYAFPILRNSTPLAPPCRPFVCAYGIFSINLFFFKMVFTT